MRLKTLLMFATVLLFFGALVWPGEAAGVSAMPDSTAGDFVASAQAAMRSATDAGRAAVAFLTAVGELTLLMAEGLPTPCLGTLTCLSMPLVLAGLWTLRYLSRILGVLQFRESAHGFWEW